MKRTITKEFSWDCAHKLYDPKLTDEENISIFGKCTNLHGHQFRLFVTISSPDDILKNGMIMNFTSLKKIVKKYVVDRFDHKNINDDCIYERRLTTCENQVLDIWTILDSKLEPYVLEEIKLYETPTSFATLKR